MNSFITILFSVQVLLIQNVVCQWNPAAYYQNGFNELAYPPEIPGGYPANLAYSAQRAATGDCPCGAFSPYGGIGDGNVVATGELLVAGNTAVFGQIPVTGAVRFEGGIPAAGAIIITGNCDCGCANSFYY